MNKMETMYAGPHIMKYDAHINPYSGEVSFKCNCGPGCGFHDAIIEDSYNYEGRLFLKSEALEEAIKEFSL